MLFDFFSASTSSTPCSGVWQSGFTRYTSLPSRERIQHHAMMAMLGCRDQHRLDALVVQQLFVVPISLRMTARLRRDRKRILQVRLVHVTNRPNPHARILLEHHHDEGSPATAADHAKRDLIRWRSLGFEQGASTREDKRSSVRGHS